jgi:membrane-bound inhibitor of C-type lysozyme
MACHDNAGTPKCLDYNETPAQINNIIPVNFTCNQGDLKVVFDRRNHLANLTSGALTTELSQVVSGSGAKYSNQKITLFTKGDSVLVFDARNESIFIFETCSIK